MFSKLFHSEKPKLREILSDPSAWGIIAANFYLIISAVLFDWNLLHILWVYLAQSAIISIFLFLKTLRLSQIQFYFFEVRKSAHIFEAVFFLIILFFLHSWLMVMLESFSHRAGFRIDTELPVLFFSLGLFFAAHFFSFLVNWNGIPKEKTQKAFSRSAKRIIGTILFLFLLGFIANYNGIYLSVPFLVFLLIAKTAIDTYSHALEHQKKKRKIKLESGLPGVGA